MDRDALHDMNSTRITPQTSAALPLAGERQRDAPRPKALLHGTFRGPLQWALEGSGWAILRPAVDLAALCLGTLVALGGPGALTHMPGVRAPLLALPVLAMLLLYLRGLYRTHLRALVLDGVIPIISGVLLATMAVVTLGLFANGRAPSQQDAVEAFLFSLLAVCSGRMLLYLAQHWARGRRLVGKPVLIMGAGLVGSQVARRLERHPEYGLMPVGFLDDDPRSIAEVGGRAMPVLGTIADLDEAVASTGVKHLIVAFSSVGDDGVSRLIQHCQEHGIAVSVVPRMFDTINNRVGYETVGGLPLMSFTAVNPKGFQFILKHAFDRVFALALLIVLSPLMLGVAIAVRLSSPGPALFHQRRVGHDGKPFYLYKFRSMRCEAPPVNGRGDEANVLDFLLAGDIAPGGVEGEDRRTTLGRVLRRWSIDELPQLFNVLRGEMSIIGPRPERPEFVELFSDDVTRYGDRHRVRAGITGWAQVHGLRGQTSLAERVEWDNYYIAHWSLGLDLKILALTVAALFQKAE
jgi:exopolysaccharide biosynthesis polyprenyl glycosylphosphotransferase